VKSANTPPHFETSSQLALSPTSLIACARRCAHGRHRAVFSQWAPPETVTTSRRSILCHENSHHKKESPSPLCPNELQVRRGAKQRAASKRSSTLSICHCRFGPLLPAPLRTPGGWSLHGSNVLVSLQTRTTQKTPVAVCRTTPKTQTNRAVLCVRVAMQNKTHSLVECRS